MKDPIIEEVRRHRMEHTREFDFDLHRICEDLRRLEKDLGDRIVEPRPKRLEPKTDQDSLATREVRSPSPASVISSNRR
uniref:Uncharacterized protein n=1 Tax=Candidatus Kentrum sp. FW TaxID=2126338 RepID=A0A450TPK4_9GAMM|nr:MAG: hypothetical protein BECKFW1821B_GA0114236_11716 [Candidatus Kentron sp. FW]